MHRLVLGISGASGMPLAQAVLENLATVSDLEVHLIISAGAERVLQAECGYPPLLWRGMPTRCMRVPIWRRGPPAAHGIMTG